MDNTFGARRKDLKKDLDTDDGRRRRDDNLIQIRKNKKNEQLAKRRQRGPATGAVGASGATSVATKSGPLNLATVLQQLRSGDEDQQKEAACAVRKALSVDVGPPIQEVIDAGLVPILVHLLQARHNPKLQFEAAWALTNVASGTSAHTASVVHAGAVPLFVELIGSPDEDVREQSIWALGNVAGDCPALRDHVLESNMMGPLLAAMAAPMRTTTQRNAVWTLSNLSRGKPRPKFASVAPMIPTLAHAVFSQDAEVLADACWALSYLSDGPNQQIQAVCDAGVVKRLVELMSHDSVSVQTPALRTVGNIVTGDDAQTQKVLNAAALPALHGLLSSDRRGIRKEATWTVSNITAGNTEQIQAVMLQNIIPVLVNMLTEEEYEIKKEAVWAISNATSGGTLEQVDYLVQQGCIHPLVALLDTPEPRVMSVALEGLENILKNGEQKKERDGLPENPYAINVEEAGGIERLENLYDAPQVEIYDKAMAILKDYFDAVEDDDEDGAPGTANNAYTFGSAPPAGGTIDFTGGFS